MPTRKKAQLILALALLAVSAIVVEAGAGRDGDPRAAVARLHDAQGNAVGTVRFLPRVDGKVEVVAEAGPLSRGFHGFHVHAIGRCEAPFTSAGGHLGTAGSGHGTHAGDMPVLFVQVDGRAAQELETDAFTVDELLDDDGSAVIVHAGPDNYANVPTRYAPGGPDATTLATGDAGARLACGVVARS